MTSATTGETTHVQLHQQDTPLGVGDPHLHRARAGGAQRPGRASDQALERITAAIRAHDRQQRESGHVTDGWPRTDTMLAAAALVVADVEAEHGPQVAEQALAGFVHLLAGGPARSRIEHDVLTRLYDRTHGRA